MRIHTGVGHTDNESGQQCGVVVPLSNEGRKVMGSNPINYVGCFGRDRLTAIGRCEVWDHTAELRPLTDDRLLPRAGIAGKYQTNTAGATDPGDL